MAPERGDGNVRTNPWVPPQRVPLDFAMTAWWIGAARARAG
jgi:hypothetical protein